MFRCTKLQNGFNFSSSFIFTKHTGIIMPIFCTGWVIQILFPDVFLKFHHAVTSFQSIIAGSSQRLCKMSPEGPTAESKVLAGGAASPSATPAPSAREPGAAL